VAVLHGALGVPQLSYRHFTAWLAAERGMACLTYDYHDFGSSATASMRKSRATLTDWGFKDQTAALDVVEASFPGLPLWVDILSAGQCCRFIVRETSNGPSC
jgi:predicted alpha/beta hydrolase